MSRKMTELYCNNYISSSGFYVIIGKNMKSQNNCSVAITDIVAELAIRQRVR